MTTYYRDFKDLGKLAKSKLLTGGVIPRPIAWITSINDNDTINLAPFSFFSVVAYDVLSVSFTQKKSGNKDTLKNILRTKEAVVNSASIKHIEHMNVSEIEYDYGVSEVDHLGLELLPSTQIKTPHLAIADVSYETKLIQHIPLFDDEGHPKSDIVLLQVIGVHLNEDVYDEAKNYIHGDRLDPASRLAGKLYGKSVVETSTTRQ